MTWRTPCHSVRIAASGRAGVGGLPSTRRHWLPPWRGLWWTETPRGPAAELSRPATPSSHTQCGSSSRWPPWQGRPVACHWPLAVPCVPRCLPQRAALCRACQAKRGNADLTAQARSRRRRCRGQAQTVCHALYMYCSNAPVHTSDGGPPCQHAATKRGGWLLAWSGPAVALLPPEQAVAPHAGEEPVKGALREAGLRPHTWHVRLGCEGVEGLRGPDTGGDDTPPTTRVQGRGGQAPTVPPPALCHVPMCDELVEGVRRTSPSVRRVRVWRPGPGAHIRQTSRRRGGGAHIRHCWVGPGQVCAGAGQAGPMRGGHGRWPFPLVSLPRLRRGACCIGRHDA